MNDIYIENENLSKAKCDLAEQVIEFAIKKLMPKFKTLEITLESDTEEMLGVKGGAVHVEKNDFQLEVANDLSKKEFITTILHEMVHVKQYAKKELKEGPKLDGVMFQEKLFPKDLPYSLQPWEIEAYKLEKELYKQFIKENK